MTMDIRGSGLFKKVLAWGLFWKIIITAQFISAKGLLIELD
jgi:hypothetical protein